MLPKFLLLLMIAAGVGAWVQRDVPPVSGWLAQARARLAVEHAIRETMLHALSPGTRPG